MEYLPYILLIITLLLIAVQALFYFGAKRVQGKPAPHHEDLLSDSERGRETLLFYFHSEHCGPCRQMTPLVAALAKERGGVVMVDVAHHLEAAHRFGVRATPTLMRIRRGVIDKVVLGGIGAEKLQRLLDDTP